MTLICRIDAAWNLSRTIHHMQRHWMRFYSQCDYITIHVPLLDATTRNDRPGSTRTDERRSCDPELCKRPVSR